MKPYPTFRLIALASLLVSTALFTGCESGEEYYTVDDFPSLEKIDAHVNINVEHPAVINQAEMDNMRLISLNVASGRDPVTDQQEVASNLQESYPGRLAWTTAFTLEHWEDPERWEQDRKSVV